MMLRLHFQAFREGIYFSDNNIHPYIYTPAARVLILESSLLYFLTRIIDSIRVFSRSDSVLIRQSALRKFIYKGIF